MGKDHEFVDDDEEEEYINMEIIKSSPSKNKEFEFQIQNSHTSNHHRETNISFPADDLFYNGKLLPLNLLSMTPSFDITKTPFKDHHNYYPLPLTAPCTNTANTPLDSSPSESCRVSCELNRDDYFFRWSNDLSCLINNYPTNKPKKLKLIKHSVLSQKLKSSRAYLKSLFTKSAKAREKTSNKLSGSKIERSFNPTIASIIKNIDKDCIFNDDNGRNNVQRRSFSSAIKRHSPSKCLSSSSSSNSSSFSVDSNGGNEMQMLRRSSSDTEIERSIEAAIAHCKKSQFDSVLMEMDK